MCKLHGLSALAAAMVDPAIVPDYDRPATTPWYPPKRAYDVEAIAKAEQKRERRRAKVVTGLKQEKEDG